MHDRDPVSTSVPADDDGFWVGRFPDDQQPSKGKPISPDEKDPWVNASRPSPPFASRTFAYKEIVETLVSACLGLRTHISRRAAPRRQTSLSI